MVKKRQLHPLPILSEKVLEEFLGSHSIKSVHVERISKYVVSHPTIKSFDEIPGLPRDAYSLLNDNFQVLTSVVSEELHSSDGTVKLLVQLQDGHTVESVIMRHKGRNTLCVSSQIGCQMACTFCATGTMGIIGNLWTGEILEQVVHANKIAKIRNVVFMGMGEPLNNYDAVLDSIHAMETRFGIAPKHITLSTVGVIPRIRQLRKNAPQVRLALSLHAPTQGLRTEIVPTATAYPLEKLMDAVDEYLRDRNRLVMIEYVMLKGVNDSLENAHQLGKLLFGKSVHINLIPYNPTDVGAQYESPDKESIKEFHAIIREKYAMKATIRENHGQDIDGACGQLAVKKIEKSAPSKTAADRDIEDIVKLKRKKGSPLSNNVKHDFQDPSFIDNLRCKLTVTNSLIGACLVIIPVAVLLCGRKKGG